MFPLNNLARKGLINNDSTIIVIFVICMHRYKEIIYRKTSSISRTKPKNLNASCILLQLSLLHPLKPGVKLRMKM